MDKAKVEDWVESQRRMKWRWAGHVARRHDSRWSAQVLWWSKMPGRRGVGKPCTRWVDDLRKFVQDKMGGEEQDWYWIAQIREDWEALVEEYVSWTRTA